MTEAKTEPTKRNEPYEGATNAIISLGKGQVYGWIGTAAGAVAGVIYAGYTTKESGRFTRRAKAALEDMNIAASGKTAVTVGWAILGSLIGHYVGFAFGVNRGLKKAGRGREQFEEMKAERNVLADQVSALETKNDDLHEELGVYRKAVHSRGEHGHAAAHVAHKETAAQAEAVR